MTGINEEITVSPLELPGRLVVPKDAPGLIVFAHGSGSSRLSPRNNYVAEGLQQAGLGTFLFDLLTEDEAADRANVFDIDLLGKRLSLVTDHLFREARLRDLAIGYFGASTGAAAALIAAAAAGKKIDAVVSRGGRPDLAIEILPRVSAATLLIVGGRDYGVIELNERAYERLHCKKALEIVPGATHLFEEPGTLDQVIDLARGWFEKYLGGASRAGSA